jgi:hypothetical protein
VFDLLKTSPTAEEALDLQGDDTAVTRRFAVCSHAPSPTWFVSKQTSGQEKPDGDLSDADLR